MKWCGLKCRKLWQILKFGSCTVHEHKRPDVSEIKGSVRGSIIDFPDEDPTTEVMAKLIHDTLKIKLKEYC